MSLYCQCIQCGQQFLILAIDIREKVKYVVFGSERGAIDDENRSRMRQCDGEGLRAMHNRFNIFLSSSLGVGTIESVKSLETVEITKPAAIEHEMVL